VLLFVLVSGERWAYATIILYYYWLCVVYGFGTVIVAMDASREFRSQTRAVDELRMNFLCSCSLGWGAHHSGVHEQMVAKDLCYQVKEARFCTNVEL
jgi:hypothetical protein